MKKLSVFVVAMFSIVAFGDVINKEIFTEISYVDSQMPNQFKQGQAVEIIYSFENTKQPTNNLLVSYQYEDAIDSFEMNIEEVGFHFLSSSPSSVLTFDSSTESFSLKVDCREFAVEGYQLLQVQMNWKNSNSIDIADNPIESFQSLVFDSYSMTFYNPETKILTSGSITYNSYVGDSLKLDFSSADLSIDSMLSYSNFISNGIITDDVFIYQDGKLVSDNFIVYNANGFYYYTQIIPEPTTCSIFVAITSLLWLVIYRRKNR